MSKQFVFGSIIVFALLHTPLSAQIDIKGKDTATTASGLKYVVMQKGSGAKVELNKEVGFHYTGYFTNGESFSTSRGGDPNYFVTGKKQLIKGMEEGTLLMREGDRFILIIPPQLAYGEKGAGKVIPPNSTLIFDQEVISVTEPKLSIGDTLKATIKKEGVFKAIQLYSQLKKDFPDKYAFRENVLNELGYALIKENRLKEAIEILKLNAAEYPKSFNVFDSLGEAYMYANQNVLAIENYAKSLTLNPENKSAIENLKKLKGTK